MKLSIKRAAWIAAGLAVIALVAFAMRPVAVLVDAATVARGALRVTVDDDGRTRVHERFLISAPIQGRLLRTTCLPGDPVTAGETVVAEFLPVAPELLDARSQAEANARLQRAESALLEAQARRKQAEADQAFASNELARLVRLHEQGLTSQSANESAERDERRASEGLRAAEFAVQVAGYEVEVARASLRGVAPSDLQHEGQPAPDELSESDRGSSVRMRADDDGFELSSPINGRVLRVFEQSDRILAAGTPILELGDTSALEIVAEYLSQDAVKVSVGMPVLVRGWGGERALRGRVRVVEPSGFTKVSALGVEEQRVNIVIDPVGDPADWAALGDGYRVELSIVLWEREDVLSVPTGALFRLGDDWAVYAIVDERAEERRVQLGRRGRLQAQVLDGLVEGERVVLYPSELLGAGTRLDAR